jgi:hypothetical protein
MKIVISALLASAVLAGVSLAGPAVKERQPSWELMSEDDLVTDLFERFDHDSDGMISREEAKSFFDEMKAGAAT